MPAFDGAEDGEEFQCAQVIDSLPSLKHWVRNVARHPRSFWLPTASDKFYPDFVAEMEDGRLLVVEYKGAHIAEGKDTDEEARHRRAMGKRIRWPVYHRGEGSGRAGHARAVDRKNRRVVKVIFLFRFGNPSFLTWD